MKNNARTAAAKKIAGASHRATTTAKSRAQKPSAAVPPEQSTVEAVAARSARVNTAKTVAANIDAARTVKQAAPAPTETKQKTPAVAPYRAAEKAVGSEEHSPAPPVETTPPGAASAATPSAPAAAQPAAGKAKPAPQKHNFKLNEFIVYPAHGVGQIIGAEVQEVAGFSLELFVVSFIKDKMILKVPTSKVSTVGMRKLSESVTVEKALTTLSGRARVKRTMWSRRAQEYESKINSGDLVTIAEVVRDLFRSESQPEQSYSERQLYEAALDRMSREIAAVRRLIDSEALKLIESFLMKGPKRGKNADESEDDVERAA